MSRPRFLRDRPSRAPRRARAKVDVDPARALQQQGEAHRLAGDYEAAERCQRESLRLRPDSVATRLALATTLQYRDQHEEAEPLFRELVRETAGAALEDYVHQHYGKCLAEMGRLEEAIACFRKALALREPGSNLAASSQRALQTAQEWLKR